MNNVIAQKVTPDEVKEIKIQIGQYRLTAEKSKGFVRKYCHNQANLLEIKLKEAFYDK